MPFVFMPGCGCYLGLAAQKKSWILLFCVLEMLLSIQNTRKATG